MKKYLILGIIVVFVSLSAASIYASEDTEKSFNDIKVGLVKKGMTAEEINNLKAPICAILEKASKGDLEKYLTDLLENTEERKNFVTRIHQLKEYVKNDKLMQGLNVKNETDCLAISGQWSSWNFGTSHFCILPTDDKGKECSDMSECQGACIAELTNEQEHKLMSDKTLKINGKCTGWAPDNGCFAKQNGMEVHKGMVGNVPLYCP